MLPMGYRWDQHAKARCAIVCVVLGAHGLFALLLSQARQGVRRSQDDNHLIWLRLESPRELPSPPPPPPTPQARERVRESEPATLPTPALPASSEPSDDVPRQIDWTAAAAGEARRAAQGGDANGYRSFGPRKPGAPPQEDAPTIFEAPKHVRGEESVDAFGDPIVWLNDHCYKELPRLITTARDLPAERPLAAFKCQFAAGKSAPRTDLFDSLKRDRPLPAPKPGSAIELPERMDPAGQSEAAPDSPAAGR
jgi:hypothetical protein